MCSADLQDSPPPSLSSLGEKLPVTWAATLGRGEARSTITSEGSTRDTSSGADKEVNNTKSQSEFYWKFLKLWPCDSPEENQEQKEYLFFSPLTADEICVW